MRKNARKEEFIVKSASYQMFGKRWCDLSTEEKKEFNRVMKRKSRMRPESRKIESEYMKNWRKNGPKNRKNV